MPTYILVNKDTGEEFSEFFTTYTKFQEYLAENPNIEQGVPNYLNIVRGVGVVKADDEFRSLLKKIKKEQPGNKIEIY